MRNLFSLSVWGADYVKGFLEVSLPTLLAPGNLGKFSRDGQAQFLIITTAEDARHIRDSAVFRALDTHVETEFSIVKQPSFRNKYKAVSRLQMMVIERSADFDTLFFLYPDFIFADGTIGTAMRRLAAGHDAIMLPVPRVMKDAVRAAFVKIPRTDAQAISLRPREFVEFSQRHIHPAMWWHLWGSSNFASYPSNLMWRAPGDGLLFRCFHLHPLAIRVQFDSVAYKARIRTTLDEEYIPRLFPDIGTTFCVPDSDEAAICSLTPESFAFDRIRPHQRPDVLYVARWAEANASVLHRQFVQHSYRWHTAGISEAEWRAVESESAACIERIQERLKIPDTVLRIEDRVSYRMRRRRARRFAYWARPSKEVSLRMEAMPDYKVWIVLFLRLGVFRFIRSVLYPIVKDKDWAPLRWIRSILRRHGVHNWQQILDYLNEIRSVGEVASIGAIARHLSRRTYRRLSGRPVKAPRIPSPQN